MTRTPSPDQDHRLTREDDNTTLSQDTVERARQATGPRAALVVHHGEAVKSVPIADGGSLVVGRAAPADVVVEDPSLSRRHARFTRIPAGLKVEDLGSTNGTHLGGARIDVATLAPGEAVSLGSVTVSFSLASASAPLVSGTESYERFVHHVEDERVRARTFGRSLALVFVRALGGEHAHVSHWVPRCRGTLRPVDRVTLWGETAALVLLPETDLSRARTVASALVEGRRLGEPTLVAGVALHAGATETLIDRARGLARQARAERRVVIDGDAEAGSVTAAPVWASPKMHALHALIERVAASQIPVLIQGETGSGKEVVARAIHGSSPRAKGPLRSVNCGAMPLTLLQATLFGHEKGAFTGADRAVPGLFEQASGGTLFLDEVGELGAPAQAALLRALETQRVVRVGGTEEIVVDVRILAATHRDLEQMVREGTFRQDLLFRLETMRLSVPPLRERPEDLQALTTRFLEEASRAADGRARRLDPAAWSLLTTHSWPGNVRELRNVIERAVVVSQGDVITPDDLPERLTAIRSGPSAIAPGAHPTPGESDADFKERVRAYETKLILDALARTGGNQTQAAKLLRMPLRTMVHKIKSYGIKKSYE